MPPACPASTARFDPFSRSHHATFARDPLSTFFRSTPIQVSSIPIAYIVLVFLAASAFALSRLATVRFSQFSRPRHATSARDQLSTFFRSTPVRVSSLLIASIFLLFLAGPTFALPRPVLPPNSSRRPALVSTDTAILLALAAWCLVTWVPTASVHNYLENFPHTSDPPSAPTPALHGSGEFSPCHHMSHATSLRTTASAAAIAATAAVALATAAETETATATPPLSRRFQ
jgi:hypothetical protein